MVVVVAHIPGLDHVEIERGQSAAAELVGRLLPQLGAHQPLQSGGLTDGAWAVFSAEPWPIEAALAVASVPAAVGVARGPVYWQHDVPQGPTARMALRLASAVRLREVLVAAPSLDATALPVGVGAFAAPPVIDAGGRPLWIVRDFR